MPQRAKKPPESENTNDEIPENSTEVTVHFINKTDKALKKPNCISTNKITQFESPSLIPGSGTSACKGISLSRDEMTIAMAAKTPHLAIFSVNLISHPFYSLLTQQ
mgnify:CR=1 FL=1